MDDHFVAAFSHNFYYSSAYHRYPADTVGQFADHPKAHTVIEKALPTLGRDLAQLTFLTCIKPVFDQPARDREAGWQFEAPLP